MLRFQFLAKEGNLSDIEKKFPPESLAPSTLRNCKVYEHVFRDHVQAGKLAEAAFMELSFADCRALMEARKLAKNAASAHGGARLKMQEAEAEALKNGLAPKDVLAAVKKADKASVTAANKAAKEKEAAQEAAKAARAAEAAKFKAWKESGAPTASAPPAPSLPDTAHELAPALWEMINTLKPRQRAAMADILRGMAERIESEAREAEPAENIIDMKRAA